MKKKNINIGSNINFNLLQKYKKEFIKGEITEVNFNIYIGNQTFPATLKYGLVPNRLKYDRKHKFKIYLEGKTNDPIQMKAIMELKEWLPSKLILIMEMLYAKEKEEVTMQDDQLEYHFTFLQY